MIRKTLWVFYFVSLLLIIFSCSNKPDNNAISSDGTNICFDHKGQGEPAIVFVHGFSMTRKYWNYQMEYFSKDKTIIQRFVDQLPDEQPNHWWSIFSQTLEWINGSKEKISEINVPIISINSDETATNVQLFREYAPTFSVKIISNTGHYLTWEEPDKFNKALEKVIIELLIKTKMEMYV